MFVLENRWIRLRRDDEAYVVTRQSPPAAGCTRRVRIASRCCCLSTAMWCAEVGAPARPSAPGCSGNRPRERAPG